MRNLKTAALAVLALGVSSVATAGMYAPPAPTGCMAGNVTVPCEKKGWSIGAEALYVQVGNVGQVTWTETDTDVESYDNYYSYGNDSMTSDWSWAFRVEASYMFGTGNDVTVNWAHLDKSSSQNASLGDADSISGNYIYNYLNYLDDDQDSVSTNINNKFDVVNLEFGQLVNFGEKVTTRFHGGLQFADIRQSLTQTALNSQDADEFDTSSAESKFSGVGPRMGADTSYNFGNGMSLFGNFALGLLIGDSSFSQSEQMNQNVEGGVVNTIGADNSFSASTSIVPEAEAKLGVAYTKPMAQGDLKIEAGYELANYWNASTLTNGIDGAYGSSDTEERSSFNYQGIFLGLKWSANA